LFDIAESDGIKLNLRNEPAYQNKLGRRMFSKGQFDLFLPFGMLVHFDIQFFTLIDVILPHTLITEENQIE
jgi:hypothetical protein